MTEPEQPELEQPLDRRSTDKRLEALEKAIRRWRLESLILYAIAAGMVVLTVSGLDQVRDERKTRVENQRLTNVLICRGQARTLTNDIDEARNDRLNAKLQLAILLNSTSAASNPALAEAIKSIREIRRNAQKVENRAIAQLTALQVNPDEVREARADTNGFYCELPSDSTPPG